MNEIVLTPDKYAGRYAISEQVQQELGQAEFQTYVDRVTGDLVCQLSKKVLTNTVAKSTYTMRVPIPDTWVDHWLVAHQGKWYSRFFRKPNFKDKTGVVTLSKAHRFPEATIRYPDHLGTVVVQEEGDIEYVR